MTISSVYIGGNVRGKSGGIVRITGRIHQ